MFSLGLVIFPVSCVEGKDVVASFYKDSAFIIQYVYGNLPQAPTIFWLSAGPVNFQYKDSFLLSVCLSEISSRIVQRWQRGLRDVPDSQLSLNVSSFSQIPLMLDIPFIPCHWAFWVLSCVNQAHFQLSHCLLKLGFFLFAKTVTSHPSAF